MPRPEKVAAVAEIKERLEGAQAVFLAEYAGLSVKEQQELRRGLREQGAEFKVVKMSLARRAAEELDIELDELLLGPTALTFADGDPVSAAKVLKTFAAGHDVFAVKGGLLGTVFLTPERIDQLAEIAPREELLAMLAGVMKAPLVSMASLLAALPRNAATMFQQLLEKKESAATGAAALETAEVVVEETVVEAEAAAVVEAEVVEAEAEVVEAEAAAVVEAEVVEAEAEVVEAEAAAVVEAEVVEETAAANDVVAETDEDDDTAEEAEEE